jgi:Chaperone of endosialidase/Head domain of trimeric autotransporter adhesin
MAKLFFTLLLAVATFCIQAQNVGIGTTTPNTNAALEISSSSKGLLIPRTSTASRTAIASPPKGLMVYDSSFSAFYYYDGGRWLPVGDKNYDSTVVDYSSQANNVVNLPTTNSSITLSGNSGFIYDNGGAAGNYLPNSNSSTTLFLEDSVIAIKVAVEEMDAENLYDSLFIISYYFDDDYPNSKADTIALTGNTTGVYTLKNIYGFVVKFKSNFQNQGAGFKIRWGRITATNAGIVTAPLYGWHFNQPKMAVMGGKPNYNNWNTDSVGFGSFNYGIGNKAKGYISTAMGKANIASGIYSIAIGGVNTASGNYSTAIGRQTIAAEINSTAIGYQAFATGPGSTAIGAATRGIGDHSTAMGYYTRATGDYSTSLGSNTKAIGEGATAMGANTNANGLISTAMGHYTNANAIHSTVMGTENYANGYSSLVAGLYNDSLVTRQTAVTNTTPLFIVGNGDFGNRSNAFVVLKNGNVAIGDNGNPVNRLHITGGTGATLSSSSGYITTGFISSTNMVIDNNELQVRLNGAASDLYLQNNGGNIAIGNTGIPAYQLELSTNSAGKPGSSSWSIASDSRLKQNINPYTQGLQQLLQINPVTYHYNEKSGFDTKPEYVGIIAQDLQKIAPYMVSTVKRKDAEYLSVDNSAMTYMLINAVKEQQQQIEVLKAEIELLKKANK